MGAKDITEKNLEAFNDVFADIINVLLFKGKNLMKEKDLEADTKDSMFKVDGKIHEQERDASLPVLNFLKMPAKNFRF